MKKYLNTLFVTTQGAYLSKDGECILVNIEREVKLRLPVHTISGIVCFGNITCSSFLMGFCAERNVSISFLTEYGKFLAKVQGPVSGNVLLRKEQYRRSDDIEESAKIARFFLIGKLNNSKTLLQKSVREHSEKIDNRAVNNSIEIISSALKHLKINLTLNQLRGIEGECASVYFKVFDNLIITQKEDFIFSERSKHPPKDEVNCLLSFVYTLMTHDIRSALECVGLDPAVGFLHRDRPGRPSLALDIIEEFRSFLGDRLVLSLINLKQVKKSDFIYSDFSSILMKDETRKIVLTAYQNRKQEEIIHPFIGEKVKIGILFYVQALLFARYIREDLDGYPPFIFR